MSVKAINASAKDITYAFKKVGKEFNLRPAQVNAEIQLAKDNLAELGCLTKDEHLNKRGQLSVILSLLDIGLPQNTTIKDYTRIFLARMYDLSPKAKQSLALFAERTGIKVPAKPPFPNLKVNA